MAKRPTGLPDFTNPPINELIMGFQFEPLSLGVVGLIDIWQSAFKKRYPKLEEHPPVVSSIETFGKGAPGPTSFQFEFGGASTPIRLWMVAEDESELVQLQFDRFVRNWRHRPAGRPYPRYEGLRRLFLRDFEALFSALKRKQAPATINQCEIAYINLLTDVAGSDLNKRLGEFVEGYDSHLTVAGCELESVAINTAWVDRRPDHPPARLRAQIVPARLPGGEHAFQFTLSYKGAPKDDSRESIIDFLDKGRIQIVSAFTEMTTESMHQAWGRIK